MMKLRHVVFGALAAAASVSPALADSLESARSMIAAGRYSDALVSLDELKGAGGAGAEGTFLRGLALVGADRKAEAEAVFRDMAQRFPDHPEAYNNLAVLQAEAGRYDEAVETLKSALRTSTAYHTAWENLTTVYGKLASEAYNRALNLGTPPTGDPVELALLETLSVPAPPVVAEPVAVAAAVPPPADDALAAAAAPAPEPAEPIATVEPAEPVAAEVGDESEPEPSGGEIEGEAAPAAVEPSASELVATVEAWAAAWADQRVEDYLAFYAAEFAPADGSSRADWAEVRRSRLTAPEYIKVSVAVLDYELAGESGSVTFNQSYESSTFSDVVTKRLDLVREDGSWRITRETVTN